MEHYLGQVAPDMKWEEAKVKLWRSVDVFGKEGSAEKEEGIKNRILTESSEGHKRGFV